MQNKTRIPAFLLAAMLMLTALPVQTQAAAAPVKLAQTKVTLDVTKSMEGTSYGFSTIKVKKAKGVKVKKITYTSKNKKTATVNKKGRVTGN